MLAWCLGESARCFDNDSEEEMTRTIWQDGSTAVGSFDQEWGIVVEPSLLSVTCMSRTGSFEISRQTQRSTMEAGEPEAKLTS